MDITKGANMLQTPLRESFEEVLKDIDYYSRYGYSLLTSKKHKNGGYAVMIADRKISKPTPPSNFCECFK